MTKRKKTEKYRQTMAEVKEIEKQVAMVNQGSVPMARYPNVNRMNLHLPSMAPLGSIIPHDPDRYVNWGVRKYPEPSTPRSRGVSVRSMSSCMSAFCNEEVRPHRQMEYRPIQNLPVPELAKAQPTAERDLYPFMSIGLRDWFKKEYGSMSAGTSTTKPSMLSDYMSENSVSTRGGLMQRIDNLRHLNDELEYDVRLMRKNLWQDKKMKAAMDESRAKLQAGNQPVTKHWKSMAKVQQDRIDRAKDIGPLLNEDSADYIKRVEAGLPTPLPPIVNRDGESGWGGEDGAFQEMNPLSVKMKPSKLLPNSSTFGSYIGERGPVFHSPRFNDLVYVKEQAAIKQRKGIIDRMLAEGRTKEFIDGYLAGLQLGKEMKTSTSGGSRRSRGLTSQASSRRTSNSVPARPHHTRGSISTGTGTTRSSQHIFGPGLQIGAPIRPPREKVGAYMPPL